MNLIRAKSEEEGWNLNLGELARIWKGGCIIRAVFLDDIKKASGGEGKRPPGSSGSSERTGPCLLMRLWRVQLARLALALITLSVGGFVE